MSSEEKKSVLLTDYIKTHRKELMDQGHKKYYKENPHKVRTGPLRLMKPRLHSKQCMNPKATQHRDSTKVRRLCYLDCPSLEFDSEMGYYCSDNFMIDAD